MFELSMSVNSNEGADIEVAYLAGWEEALGAYD
jgi:hypothetical protein